MRSRLTMFLVACGLLSVIASCDRDEIHAYRAPKTKARAMEPEVQSRVAWTVPQGWESVPGDQPMRLATFKPGQGLPEVTMSAFPGDTGGLLANINRWRGQVGLGPIEESQLAGMVEMSSNEGVAVTIADIPGAGGKGLLGAIIVPGDGQTWFLKATGEPEAIAKLKPVFGAFARTFHLHAEQPASGSGSGGIAPTQPTGEVQARLTAWKLPEHWRADPNASAIVAAAFDATNQGGGAKITATMLMNDGGGVMANINRWRDQLGLSPVVSLDQQKTTDLGHGNLMVDLSSADNSRRMIAAIVSNQGQTWFFKMTGPAQGVEVEKADYERFVRTVGLGESGGGS